jgi:DNA-binding response OmpR family regulator
LQILIVEDDEQIAGSLKKNLLSEGHSALISGDGEDALKKVSEIEFDAILLDWRIPKITGIEVCKRLREEGLSTPIILLTALSDISNKIEALNNGADDYITKPFSFDEVMARINAVVRRFKTVENEIMFGTSSLKLLTRELETSRGMVELSDKEFSLLKYLLRNRGIIISKETLSEKVWEIPYSASSNVIEATVKNLRKKLESSTDKQYIKTAYGEGYIFIAD